MSCGIKTLRRTSPGAFLAVLAVTVLFASVSLRAAPMDGEEFEYTQPDGTVITVLLFGDEYHVVAETRDGYTLVAGDDGWVTFAELSADGQTYVSTGVRYMGRPGRPNVRQGARIGERGVREKRQRNIDAIGGGALHTLLTDPATGATASFVQPSPQPNEGPQIMRGVTIFLEFPDVARSSITRTQVDQFFNQRNLNTTGGSVFDWFNDVSNGQLHYTNAVSDHIMMPRTKAYYDDGCSEGYRRVSEFVLDALTILKQRVESGQFSLGNPSTENRSGRQTVLALNIFATGGSGCAWARGMWPHSGTFTNTTFFIRENNVQYYFRAYQLSNVATNAANLTNSLGVVIHENGHMIMRWPDLYPYVSGQRNFVAGYCVMSSNSQNNPQTPNPYFRELAGWVDVVDVTNMNADLSHVANSNSVYRFRREGATNESFYIEARRRTGRSAGLPGDGLIIWHVHTGGDNANFDVNSATASRRYPRVAVVQANNGTGNPTANAPFIESRQPNFNSTTAPAARWHNTSSTVGTSGAWAGAASAINISRISALPANAATPMTFRIGTGGTVTTRTLTVTVNPTAGGSVTVNGTPYTGPTIHNNGASVTLAASPAANHTFVNWTGADAPTGAGATNPTATITMSANRSITANFQASPVTYSLTVQNGTGSGTYASGTTVNITAPATSGTGANASRFLRWSSSRLTPADIYNNQTTVITAARADTVIAHYGRVHALPGTVEADTFGYAWGIRPLANTANGATGNMAARVDSVNGFAEYWVNVGAAGNYRLSYRLLIGRSAGRFVVRDLTNNIALDTVTVPTGAISMITVAGRMLPLSAGRALWRIESLSGQYSIDWFAVEPAVTVLTVNNGTGSGAHPYGSVVNIGAIVPDTIGYSFDYWDGDSASLAAVSDVKSPTAQVTIGARSITLTAVSSQKTAVLTVENGTGSGIYPVGSVVEIHGSGPTALGWSFENWTGDSASLAAVDDVNSISAVVTITGTDSISLTAIFKYNTSVNHAAGMPLIFDIRAASNGNVSFQIPKTERVSIRVYDVKGKMVATLSDEVKTPGFYRANISAARGSNLGSGLYIVRMRSGSFNKNVKVHYRR